MSEQSEMLLGEYWCSFITAAPVPEIPERAIVALVFGNGKPVYLATRRHLPRLASLASIDSVYAYEAVLKYASECVAHGRVSVEELRGVLAPHLHIEPPRRLEGSLSDQMIARLSSRFLEGPVQPKHDSPQHAVMRASLRSLDQEITAVKKDGVAIQKNITPEKLYGPRVRSLRISVPPVVRALRAPGRDVLVDSVRVDAEFDEKSLRSEAMRVCEAFYIYRERIIPEIVAPLGKELRLVAVLHKPAGESTPDLEMRRDFIRSVWSDKAHVVVDASMENVGQALARVQDWVLGESAH